MLHSRFLDLAIQTARKSKSRQKVGAVLLRGRKIVSLATNLEDKSHPFQAMLAEKVGMEKKIFLHAEINALIKARESADTIIIARVGGQCGTKLRLAKPCAICSFAIKQSSIKKVIYSTNQGFLYQI